jgi:nucleotide-binding universal stress UspA family protein
MEATSSKGEGDLAVADIRNILVNLTPTRDWGRVAEFAVRHARRLGARLYFVDVIYDPFGYSGWNLPMPSLEKEYQAIVGEARDHLRAIMQARGNDGIVMESIVREGEPAAKITEVIEEKKIDLLVVPAHPEDKLESFLFESVNRKLMRDMPCSIMMLKTLPEDLE